MPVLRVVCLMNFNGFIPVIHECAPDLTPKNFICVQQPASTPTTTCEEVYEIISFFFLIQKYHIVFGHVILLLLFFCYTKRAPLPEYQTAATGSAYG